MNFLTEQADRLAVFLKVPNNTFQNRCGYLGMSLKVGYFFTIPDEFKIKRAVQKLKVFGQPSFLTNRSPYKTCTGHQLRKNF